MASTTESGTPAADSARRPDELMSGCCAFYEQDWVRRIAEDSFHPGGADLTRRTVAAMGLAPGACLTDLGCGTGTSTIMLAGESGLRVTGVDISGANVARARVRAAADGADVEFVEADAHDLPFADATFDGVLAECVFSLLVDRTTALAEIRRVLKPGGRLGVTDMTVDGPLPEDISAVVAPWACLNDTLDEDAWTASFEAAGFGVRTVADESGGLTSLIRKLKRRLLLLGAGSTLAGVPGPRFDLTAIRYWLDRFRTEVDQGAIRYLRFDLQSQGASDLF